MNSFGKIFFALGLVLLMLFKVSAFHIYEHCEENEHHEDHEECHLCDIALQNQVTELNFSPQIDFIPNVAPTIQTTFINKHFEAITDLPYEFGLCSRPPPSLL